MSEVGKIVREYAEEYAKEKEENMVKKLLKTGMPVEIVAEAAELLTPEEISKLAEAGKREVHV